MRRETQNILLLLLGGALLKIAVNGDYLRYVKPSLRPWLLGAAAVMVLLGVVAIARDILAARRRARADGPAGPSGAAGACGHDADDADGTDGTGGHAHHHPARSAWLLVLPVFAVFLVVPPALGSDSVKRSGTAGGARAVAGSEAAFPPLPPGEVVPLSLTEFASRAGWDRTGSLVGRTVALTGFVVHSGGRGAGDGGATMLARMVIGCCAADAYAVRVRLVGPGAAEAAALPDDTWIDVTGRLVPGSATPDNTYLPDLTVHTVTRTPAPPTPYEY